MTTRWRWFNKNYRMPYQTEGIQKQSPLWQFPDVFQQSTWPAHDSPGRCGHFLSSSTLFPHPLCTDTARNRLSNFNWHYARICIYPHRARLQQLQSNMSSFYSRDQKMLYLSQSCICVYVPPGLQNALLYFVWTQTRSTIFLKELIRNNLRKKNWAPASFF